MLVPAPRFMVIAARSGWTRACDLTPGAHIAVIGGTSDMGIEGRLLGLELRDTILVLRSGPSSSFVFLFRVPVAKDMAEQVLATGTGVLNVDACRVGTTKRVPGSLSAVSMDGFGLRTGRRGQNFDDTGKNPNIGRWPSNFVLVHDAGCKYGECEERCPVRLLDGQSKDASHYYPKFDNDAALIDWLTCLVSPV